MPRKLLPVSEVIRNMMMAEINEAVIIPPRKSVVAVDLPFAAAQKINGCNRRACAQESAKWRQESAAAGDNVNVGDDDQSQNRAERRPAGDSQHVRIGQGIAKQGLKSRTRDG